MVSALDDLGAIPTANASREQLLLSIDVLRNAVPQAMELFADTVLNPRFGASSSLGLALALRVGLCMYADPFSPAPRRRRGGGGGGQGGAGPASGGDGAGAAGEGGDPGGGLRGPGAGPPALRHGRDAAGVRACLRFSGSRYTCDSRGARFFRMYIHACMRNN